MPRVSGIFFAGSIRWFNHACLSIFAYEIIIITLYYNGKLYPGDGAKGAAMFNQTIDVCKRWMLLVVMEKVKVEQSSDTQMFFLDKV